MSTRSVASPRRSSASSKSIRPIPDPEAIEYPAIFACGLRRMLTLQAAGRLPDICPRGLAARRHRRSGDATGDQPDVMRSYTGAARARCPPAHAATLRAYNAVGVHARPGDIAQDPSRRSPNLPGMFPSAFRNGLRSHISLRQAAGNLSTRAPELSSAGWQIRRSRMEGGRVSSSIMAPPLRRPEGVPEPKAIGQQARADRHIPQEKLPVQQHFLTVT